MSSFQRSTRLRPGVFSSNPLTASEAQDVFCGICHQSFRSLHIAMPHLVCLVASWALAQGVRTTGTERERSGQGPFDGILEEVFPPDCKTSCRFPVGLWNPTGS